MIQLQQKGINAVLLNSDLTKMERRAILDGLPLTNLLYLAPEQLRSKDLLEALFHCRVARVAVDEAHVLPQTMLGFRKAYGRIDEFLSVLPERPQVIACTATATKKTRKHICNALRIPGAKMFTLPVRRNNLCLQIKKMEGSKKGPADQVLYHAVERELDKWEHTKKKGSVIIYVPTVKRVKRIHKWLKARGWKTGEALQKVLQVRLVIPLSHDLVPGKSSNTILVDGGQPIPVTHDLSLVPSPGHSLVHAELLQVGVCCEDAFDLVEGRCTPYFDDLHQPLPALPRPVLTDQLHCFSR